MNGNYIDISVSLREDLPVWPGDPAVGLPPAARIANGDPVNVTGIRIGTHTGTHIDAEWHFIQEGGRLNDIAFERLVGPCTVVDFSDATSSLTSSDFERAGIPTGTTRILLKTKNSELWRTSSTAFSNDYVGITPDGARWLVEHHLDFVGIDYLSVEPPDADGETHRTMLGAGQIILETIDLGYVEPGQYTLYCLPLRIDGADGAPARAILGPA